MIKKICCFNQKPHFSAFERHAEVAAREQIQEKNDRSPSSRDFNQLDYHVRGAMLQECHKLQPKPKTTDELKVALQTIWEELPQEHIHNAVTNFIKCYGCRWWSLQASAVTLFTSKSATSSHHQQNGSFHSRQCLERGKMERVVLVETARHLQIYFNKTRLLGVYFTI